jgi:hypothetical protein
VDTNTEIHVCLGTENPFPVSTSPLKRKDAWVDVVFQVVNKKQINYLSATTIGHPHLFLWRSHKDGITVHAYCLVSFVKNSLDSIRPFDPSVGDMDCSGNRIRIRLEMG